MNFSMILAIDKNNLIGDSKSNNGLPWHYKEDLQFYKQKTINKINIMGRKTFDQIGKALPNRTTIVITHDTTFEEENIITIHSLSELETYLQNHFFSKEKEIMVVGGIQIFELLFSKINTIYLTRIQKEYHGDTWYNNLNLSKFKLIDTKVILNGEVEFQTWKRI